MPDNIDARSYKLSDIKKLFALSGNQCCAPGCSNKVISDDWSTVTGEICHISAASENGPRYVKNMTNDERRSYDNLILLCPSHHKEIDNPDNEKKYTVEMLLNWKKKHVQSLQLIEISNEIVVEAVGKFNKNHLLRELFEKLSGKDSVKAYIQKQPFIFRDIIEILYPNNRTSLSKYRKIDKYRYELIETFFYNYLDLFRYSILAILWEEIDEDKIETDKEEVYDLLSFSVEEIHLTHIGTLKNLVVEILENWGSKVEVPLVKELNKSIKEIEFGVEFFASTLDEAIDQLEKCWQAELFWHQLISLTSFLSEYKFKSVYSRGYIKFRDTKIAQYNVDYRFYNKDIKSEIENTGVNPQFQETYSIYLCLKRNEAIVLNLSPFYFDKNSIDGRGSNNLIHLHVLKQIVKDYDDLDLIFKEVPNPDNLANRIESNSSKDVIIGSQINSDLLNTGGLNETSFFNYNVIFKQFEFVLKKLEIIYD